jgi:sugar phosphate isomerase/epimerase
MLTRRRFFAFAAAAAACGPALCVKARAAATRSGVPFGVQLYTVRKMIGDLAATLRLIQSIGYATIETFPPVYNRPAKELKALVNNAGLTAPSGHFDYETLEEKVDYAAEVGLKYMICPQIPRPQWDSLDGFKQAAEHYNKVAARARAAGVNFGFHPLNYEYKQLPGGRGIDVLMRELDPSVRLELDIYWAVEGGQNPLEMMEKHRDRLALIHIKDRKPATGFTYVPEGQTDFAEAGSGTIDWKADLGEARRLGVAQFFVDQDESDLPVEQSLRVNWKYLSQLSF